MADNGFISVCAKEKSMKLQNEAYHKCKELKDLFLSGIREQASQHKKSQIKEIFIWITIVFIIVFVFVVFFLSLYFVLIYPVNQISQFGINNVSEKADLINKYRTTSIQFIATYAQILGGLAVGIGAYAAWGNFMTAKEGQITERFTRAIDQLGNKKIEIKLGGIFALERISTQSKKDYWPIMEILTTYVRMNSNIDNQSKEESSKTLTSMETQSNGNIIKSLKVSKIPLDIQAAMTIIGRRKPSFNNGEQNRLILYRCYLPDINLEDANLRGIEFCDANLEGANLCRANLEDADLWNANLERAELVNAHLKGACLWNTHLKGACLLNADLKGALLADANLEGAELDIAHLKGANLSNAHLEGTSLFNTNLKGANLNNAYLKGAKFLTVNQLSKVKTLYKAQLDPGLEGELRKRGYSHLLDDEPEKYMVLEKF